MKQDMKKILWCILLMVVYITLGLVGVYEGTSFILAPILAIPLIIYLVKSSPTLGMQCVLNGVTIASVYLITDSLQSTLIYIICIALPAYAITWLYRNKLPLPNIIIYGTVISAVLMYMYIMIMKSLGYNYELAFIELVDEVKQYMLQSYKEVSQMMGYMNESDQATVKSLLGSVMDVMKQVYPAFIMMGAFAVTLLQVLIVNWILRIKDRTLPSIKQLLAFRVSKLLILIIVGAIIVLSVSTNSAAVIISMNLVLIINMLFCIMGALSFIGLINRTSASMALKILGYILIVFLYSTTPTLLIIFGVLDTIFNYRKVNIIV